MKKIILLSAIALTSCGKFKFENKVQGSWTLHKGKPTTSLQWYDFPSTEDPVVITESHISNPWDKPYTVQGKTILMDSKVIKVDVKKKSMLWVFENNDSLKFIR
jgi:hypothetical protein